MPTSLLSVYLLPESLFFVLENVFVIVIEVVCCTEWKSLKVHSKQYDSQSEDIDFSAVLHCILPLDFWR